MPKYKDGVQFTNMAHEITSKLPTIDEIHKRLVGREAIITSGRDGVHKPKSLHYEGKAIDLRTQDMKPGRAQMVVGELKMILGINYDIILESDHIHLEYDPH